MKVMLISDEYSHQSQKIITGQCGCDEKGLVATPKCTFVITTGLFLKVATD